jgi:Bacterial SH3 domain
MIKMRFPLLVGAWLATAVPLLGVGVVATRPPVRAMKPLLTESPALTATSRVDPVKLAQLPSCQTIATDPQPPLNIRTTPQVSIDNIAGTVPNGTVLRVIGGSQGWLQIQAPVAGWIFHDLTTTVCGTRSGQAATVHTANTTKNPTAQLIATATDRFHAGELATAIALLNSIPATDRQHGQAQQALKTMARQWQQSQIAYQLAQTAVAKGQWQAAIAQARTMPDVRYWRSKMAPIAQLSIRQLAIAK